MSIEDRPQPAALGYAPAETAAVPSLRAALGLLAGHLVAVCFALLGGVLGILGAFIQEFRSGGFILLPFLGAPIIEELMKPAGVYLLLARWPRLLKGRLHVALLTALGGLSFGVIEALVYIFVYVPDPPQWFVTYRFAVGVPLHTAASFLVGLGLSRDLIEWAAGRARFPRAALWFIGAGIALHAVFNTTVTALGFAGFFPEV